MNITALIAAAREIEALCDQSKARAQAFLTLAHEAKSGGDPVAIGQRRCCLDDTVVVYDDALNRLCRALHASPTIEPAPTPLRIYHIFTVTPIAVQPHELPAVKYGDYLLASQTLQQAYQDISGYIDIVQAAEVYGAERETPPVDGVIVDPASQHNQRVTLNHHQHWSHVQDRYERLKGDTAIPSGSPEDAPVQPTQWLLDLPSPSDNGASVA